jgi:hypothetical protein
MPKVVIRILLVSTCMLMPASARSAPIHYEKEVRPIFKAMCFHCHGEEEKPKGNLDLRLVRLMFKGGDSGSSIVPGKPEESHLWERIESDEMPEGSKKLTSEQKRIIKTWIAEGAKTQRPEPADPNLARYTEEELAHWAFQPVKKPSLPHVQQIEKSRNQIDLFVLEKLEKEGWTFSPEADRVTLIRRLYYDLIGLPPSAEEVQAFLTDEQPQAYERLVEKLLRLPQYGERWARHWLDVAGYAESDGNAGKDNPRPHAWHYRDYVIRSFNQDKPYDQFVREQIAGDELAKNLQNLTDADTIEKLTATGFLLLRPDVTQTSNTIVDKNQAVADSIKVVSSAILGLTVGCAQCHDHRYDPISIEDHYRLRAIFDPAFDLKVWKQPNQRLVDVTTAEVRAEQARIEEMAKQKDAEVIKFIEDAAKPIYEAELAKIPESDRANVLEAIALADAKKTPAQVELLKKYPSFKTLKTISFSLAVYNQKARAEEVKRRNEVAKFRETKPPSHLVMAVVEQPGNKNPSKVMFRGDPENLKQPVEAGELQVIARHRSSPNLPKPAEVISTTKRRLNYANWLTDGTHPLTARVMVNRLWMHHFGRGIVNTPSEFGLNGDRPSHPELLDWLAADFVESGWQIKRLHRQIVNSAVYRQQSTRIEAHEKRDPDNKLLSRMTLRRLDAESLRDSLLVASGKLYLELHGPSVPVSEDAEGKVVFGRRIYIEGLYASNDSVGNQAFRRSLYVESSRAIPLSILESFDLPVMTPNCDVRRSSTVPTQSLLMLNDIQIIEHSKQITDRVRKKAPEKLDEQIRELWRILFQADPTSQEIAMTKSYFQQQLSQFAGQVKGPKHSLASKAEEQAFMTICQALLCSNRFLYID